MLLSMQAIQARQVLRGTVGELVKETRKAEAEGMPLATLSAALYQMFRNSKDLQPQGAASACKNKSCPAQPCFRSPCMWLPLPGVQYSVPLAAAQVHCSCPFTHTPGIVGGKKEQAPAVSVHAKAAEGKKKPRGVQPGSFLNLMINSKHSNGEPFSDLLASSQAFTFLLVRLLLCTGLQAAPPGVNMQPYPGSLMKAVLGPACKSHGVAAVAWTDGRSI